MANKRNSAGYRKNISKDGNRSPHIAEKTDHKEGSYVRKVAEGFDVLVVHGW